ncbi:MAG: tRNA adenosine(34) deaminase TadA [Coriobacteriales bacterium]|jgi:tRNA(adenine34) deaminase|nr:tRNA adenosine(34) deaminase TadA [Coriobacteriales bacterium]
MIEHDLPSECGDVSDAMFMRLAIEQARVAASIGEVPIGAVVVCENEVVATGYNRREIDTDPSAHAEFTALVEASRRLGRWRLTGCTVYVTLEPCLMCAGLMQLSRVDRCVFGAFDPKGGALGTLYEIHRDERLNHRFEVSAGICEQECSALLSEFFAQLRGGRRGDDGRRGGDGGRGSESEVAGPASEGNASEKGATP